jgi:sulfate adenylyltransferase
MKSLIPPHGGKLIERVAQEAEREELLARAPSLPRVDITPRQFANLEMIATGVFSPLDGFQGKEDYRSVLAAMRLADGVPWSIPIVLAVDRTREGELEEGATVALYADDAPVGLVEVTETYLLDKEREAMDVYRTAEEDHPGVAAIRREGELALAGPVTLLQRKTDPLYERYRLDPKETRYLFNQKGWSSVVAFQTRNPIHRAHEYLTKCALEMADGVLIHPLVGETRKEDIPVDVRIRCYEALLESYYPKERVLLSVLPANMHYAGPREAIHHAIMRQNYGCTHFIVGRDHAGVGDYYGTYDAQYIFDEFDPSELRIQPLRFEHAFWCKRTGGMATTKTSPSGPDERIFLSGTKVREMLSRGELPPEEFTRPEVARILIESYQNAKQTT